MSKRLDLGEQRRIHSRNERNKALQRATVGGVLGAEPKVLLLLKRLIKNRILKDAEGHHE